MISSNEYDASLTEFSSLKDADIDGNAIEKLKVGRDSSIWLDCEFDKITYNLHQFVEKVLHSHEPAFRRYTNTRGRIEFEELPLGKYLSLMPVFLSSYWPQCKYVEQVELFFECCRNRGLLDAPYSLGRRPFKPTILNPEKLEVDEFNELLDYMREEAKKPKFKERVRQRERNSRRNFLSAKKYQDALFEKYSRLLVLRIDFGYLEEYSALINEERSIADIQRFFNNRRGKRSLFAALVGYILKREWGGDKRFHFHLILYFDGSRVRQDVYLAKRIGEYWKALTDGMGTYFNCNACKDKYQRLGIGMVKHDDLGMRDNLLIAIKYLSKEEQFIHATSFRNKVFLKGAMPSMRTIRIGRPRKDIGCETL